MFAKRNHIERLHLSTRKLKNVADDFFAVGFSTAIDQESSTQILPRNVRVVPVGH